MKRLLLFLSVSGLTTLSSNNVTACFWNKKDNGGDDSDGKLKVTDTTNKDYILNADLGTTISTQVDKVLENIYKTKKGEDISDKTDATTGITIKAYNEDEPGDDIADAKPDKTKVINYKINIDVSKDNKYFYGSTEINDVICYTDLTNLDIATAGLIEGQKYHFIPLDKSVVFDNDVSSYNDGNKFFDFTGANIKINGTHYRYIYFKNTVDPHWEASLSLSLGDKNILSSTPITIKQNQIAIANA